MSDFKTLAEEMRKLGVARLRYTDDAMHSLVEIELAPYVFDPPREDLESDLEDIKRSGQCEYPGCDRANGWNFLPTHCREHGLIAMGVQVDG